MLLAVGVVVELFENVYWCFWKKRRKKTAALARVHTSTSPAVTTYHAARRRSGSPDQRLQCAGAIVMTTGHPLRQQHER